MSAQPSMIRIYGVPPRTQQMELLGGAHEVFVDSMMECIPNPQWRWSESCHLFVKPETPLEFLHAFALRLGMRPKWFQNKAGKMPHYDLTKARREKAIKNGAVALTRPETVAIFRAWRGDK